MKNGDKNWVLSDKEVDILTLIAEGKTSKEIGKELFCAPKTIDSHRANMLNKTGAKNMPHLIAMVFRENILT